MPGDPPTDQRRDLQHQADIFAIGQRFREGAFHRPITLSIPSPPDPLLYKVERVRPIPPSVRINFGVPTDSERFISGDTHLSETSEPHIFKVNNLTVIQPNDRISLQNVVVLMAHARRDPDDQWIFGDGQSVRAVVEAYQRYAEENNLPKIEFIVACNREEIIDDNISHNPLVQDIPTEYEIVQVVGDTMGAIQFDEMRIPMDGKPNLWVTTKQGQFWGLDHLEEKKHLTGDAQS